MTMDDNMLHLQVVDANPGSNQNQNQNINHNQTFTWNNAVFEYEVIAISGILYKLQPTLCG